MSSPVGRPPGWADLPISRVEPNGWDNTTFRLGDNLSVRLPSGDAYSGQVDKEHRWLPVLAPHLPLPIPEPVAEAEPSSAFPRPWSIYRWLDGERATLDRIASLERFAVHLARFLHALSRVAAVPGPPAGPHSQFRGGPLTTWDKQTRAAIAALDGHIDTEATTAVWETALKAELSGEPTWVHGDVAATNLLVVEGELSAVIDFGCTAVGDQACDLVIAWTIFDKQSRNAFRDAFGVDDATWARGRGWALWKALLVLRSALVGDTSQPPWHQMGWRNDASQVVEDVLAEP